MLPRPGDMISVISSWTLSTRTMGRCPEASSSISCCEGRAYFPTASMSRTMMANGFCSLLYHLRRWARLSRVQQICIPPQLLMTPTLPCCSPSAKRVTASPLLPRPLSVKYVIDRTAARTGYGLMVEAATGRVLVLGTTVRAHGERPHRGLLPVIREIVDDGEAGTAIGAVGEWIEVSPVRRVEHLPQARAAYGEIVRDGDPPLPSLALHDPEAHRPSARVREPRTVLHPVQAGQGRQGPSSAPA